MGDQPSAPFLPSHDPKYNFDHVTQLQLPGRPYLVASSSLPADLVPVDLESHMLVEVYLMDLYLNEEELLLGKKLYRQRKGGLPWHVRVLSFTITPSLCYCADSKLSAVIVTEHIPYRLSSFAVARGPNLQKYRNYQKLSSLTTNQSIYLLVSCLQGYRVLYEQYLIQWPTLNSIGVTLGGGVKVWIGQNWASNFEHHSPLPETAIIQQILQLVFERTEEQHLQQVVRSKGNSFENILDILGQFIIECNQGRQSLRKKIQNGKCLNQQNKVNISQQNTSRQNITQAIIRKKPSWKERNYNRKQGKDIQTQKYSLKEENILQHPILQLHPQSNIVESQFFKVQQPRRLKSQQLSTPIIDISRTENQKEKRARSTQNTTRIPSPIKPIHFTYLNAPGPSPIREQPILSKDIPKSTFFYPQVRYQNLGQINRQYNNKSGLKLSKNHPFPLLSLSQDRYTSSSEVKFVQEKYLLLTNKRQPTYISKPVLIQAMADLEQVKSCKTIKKQDESKPTLTLNKTVHFATQEPINSLLIPQTPPHFTSSHHQTPENESLSDLTQEFRLLLQSNNQIDRDLQLQISDYSSYSDMRVDSESYVSEPMVEGHIYSIKEVDEEVSYEVSER